MMLAGLLMMLIATLVGLVMWLRSVWVFDPGNLREIGKIALSARRYFALNGSSSPSSMALSVLNSSSFFTTKNMPPRPF